MCKQKIVLLKITGEFLRNSKEVIDATYVREIARQVHALRSTHYFGIVVGGGNFFRGTREGVTLGMNPNTSDQVGMLATLMNGVILQDLFAQEGVEAQLFSALECPSVAATLSPQELRFALRTRDCIIFSGGMGNPFFTTDTTAIVRAIQIEAQEIWKATKVDGVYTHDPRLNAHAQKIASLTYTDALTRQLGIMDETAFALAREHKIPLRVFSLFTPHALIRAAHEASFGSMVMP